MTGISVNYTSHTVLFYLSSKKPFSSYWLMPHPSATVLEGWGWFVFYSWVWPPTMTQQPGADESVFVVVACKEVAVTGATVAEAQHPLVLR